MTREEHLEWCKQRARVHLDKGDVKNAIASMMSDMQKHPDTAIPTAGVFAMIGLAAAASDDLDEARRYVEYFR